jgi:hypothetical protein
MSWPETTETNRNAGARLTETIERIRWRLWHGQVKRARDLIAETIVTVDVAADDKSPIAAAARKVARLLGDLETYVSGQSDIVIDYATRTNFDGDHREHGAMAAASANECPTANALVSAGRSFDAESPDLRHERDARSRLCRGGALGPPPVSQSGLTPHVPDGLRAVCRREQQQDVSKDAFARCPGCGRQSVRERSHLAAAPC